jgi:AbrB family looped-hinge helix DNA binding protein
MTRYDNEDGSQFALVRVDDKCRLVIPKRVRQRSGLRPGTAVFVVAFEGLVFLKLADVSMPSIRELLGEVRS